ncbi:MAG: hypothetical protein LBH85_05940 [Treponema sp.]|nr:hypothetical protein [Treponema sp.]
MSEVKDLIEKTVNPPGIHKKNRRSLFGAIRDIGERVRADALTAFNAHFPYLADSAKLEEHGAALLIPRLLEDTEEEFRERVAAASFFLMRAGERGYIAEQLDAHFGNTYIAREEFLRVFVKVIGLSERDRRWLLEFLDSLINPNVRLTVSEWVPFIDAVLSDETRNIRLLYGMSDSFREGSLKYGGGAARDDMTAALSMATLDAAAMNEEANFGMRLRHKYDGRHKFDGSFKYNGGALLPLEEEL